MANRERRKKDSARLVWDTKPRRAPNPRDIEFQTAEIVIPNWQRDHQQIPFSFRDTAVGEAELDKQKMNRLIWGDNLLAMQALLAHGYEGKINLIYIDPPFATSEDYYFKLKLGGEEFTKEPSVIERLAYKDTWAGGIDSYLDMLYPRLQLMKRLLAENGTIYVHLGPNISHYVKVLLDEIFGRENFVNEIVWKRQSAHSDIGQGATHLGRLHETILLYRKGPNPTWNPIFQPYDEEYIAKFYKHVEPETGRRYQLGDLTAPGGEAKGNPRYEFLGVTRYWRFSKEKMEELYKQGRIVQTKPGAVPRYKRYLDEMPGVPLQDLWLDIKPVQSQSSERVDLDTQKPTALLERIIQLSSNPGDLVADFFCGSGTTLVAAEKLGRRWIGCDFSKVAIQITRSRLVQMDAKPFLIENIGNYQREMIYLSGGRVYEMQRVILKLYGATPHPHHRDLGTRHAPEDGVLELVYVGYPDRPVTAKKAEELARMAETLDGTGYKRLVILAWDYDYNYTTELENRLKAAKPPIQTEIVSRSIPPDIYDYLKKAKDDEELEPLREKIRFYEKPYLKLSEPEVKPLGNGKAQVTVGLERYVVFDFPVKEKERKKLLELVKDNFAVLIDYWAVDWDYDGHTFKSQWQDMRGTGRRTKVVTTKATTELKMGRKYTIAVRVVDVFGNDAAGTVKIDLGEGRHNG